MVYLVMLCDVYSGKGYYISAHQDLPFDIAFSLDMDEARVREIIDYCVELRLFDAAMLAEKGVYTSIGIQDRFNEVCKRSVNRMDPAYLLEPQRGVSVTETPVSAAETPANKNKIKIKFINRQTKGINEEVESISLSDDALRRAELQRMAEAATGRR